ncbi:methylated-DNA--[protein]-cysteine S-methyltransferase [Clostridium sp. NSJ-49]|uniref:methylated-DNA--[protein]-cysteine S-methyltransferase n=1 Tax=Clostridium TaxID=1485 RepID=UPI00164AFDD8|nr:MULTISPECIES: methylated-DNA--[protein]-cysteine S-methyltransferase [unclassified Clostridium]MBC5624661.1 methylated-DNA--[protein]-cysteine S-methyltransferase [Clostridium sp. NSJ-49]MCD2501281.1 methylated-DNA--[protein]-cysteine S-methyltransferase [Clostridium sp. NSJ-145]
MNYGYYESPIGKIKIEAEGESIIGVSFSMESSEWDENEAVIQCKNQLQEYFEGKRKEFDLNIKFIKGTEFQISVWKALSNISYGEKITYKSIAEKINNPKAVRAVGGANNKNPIAIIIPCHRVVGSNGKMVGYAGGIDKKEYLLKLEEKNS